MIENFASMIKRFVLFFPLSCMFSTKWPLPKKKSIHGNFEYGIKRISWWRFIRFFSFSLRLSWSLYFSIKISTISKEVFSVEKTINFFLYRFGFVPNGGRVYYLDRSQPPLLTAMLFEYFEATGDLDFVKEILPLLEMELTFWNTKRMVSISKNYSWQCEIHIFVIGLK